VSRVINQSAPVSSNLENKVKAAIAELDYRPQTAARALAGQKTHTIGLLLAEIGTDFYPLMIRAIEAEARKNHFNLLINVAGDDTSIEGEIPYTLGEYNSDGVLVFPASLSDDELYRMHLNNFPVVLVQRRPPAGLEFPCITIENKLPARKMVDHLIEVHGFRRIAFLSGLADHEDARRREQGYHESLESHGIPYDPTIVAQGYFQKQASQDAVCEWITAGFEFDAIFACDDISAIGALSALNRAGLNVPNDVAVVGFDDIEVSRFLSPPLTTVKVPIQEIGRAAIQQLLAFMNGEVPDMCTHFETELVIRRSCGCR